MIKRIIFDIDDTLMPFPKQFEEGYKNVLKKYNLEIEPKKLYNIIGEYETSGKYKYYDKEELIKLLNKRLNMNLDDNFVDDFFEMYNALITPIPKDVVDTLGYLKSKYELVTLSNWFTNSQEARLKKAGILKYFDKVYGTDIVPMKPSKESYMSVIGNNKIEECAIVGDNFDMDIKVPIEIGMNVYYLTNKETSYPSIKKISDLKDVL